MNFIINIYSKKTKHFIGGVMKHFGVMKYTFGAAVVNFEFIILPI